jgi:hypothetical protein
MDEQNKWLKPQQPQKPQKIFKRYLGILDKMAFEQKSLEQKLQFPMEGLWEVVIVEKNDI